MVRKWPIAALTLIAVAIASVEGGARLAGVTDIPLYERTADGGYRLKPSQSGAFLHVNHWYVNDEGFNNSTPYTPATPNVILMGDSVVYGGNHVDDADRVGTIAQKKSGTRIWVGAANGWGLVNELDFLEGHKPFVARANGIVFVLNNGDPVEDAKWPGETTYPTAPPPSAALYLLRRYVLPHPPEQPYAASGRNVGIMEKWRGKMDALLREYGGPIAFILYPDEVDYRSPGLWAANTAPLRAYAARHPDRIRLYDVGKDRRWRTTFYRDGIHPTQTDGNSALGGIVASQVTSLLHRRELNVRNNTGTAQ